MSLKYFLKIKAYSFFNTRLGKLILNSLSGFISAKGLRKTQQNQKNKAFIVSITIDTESGYVSKNDYRIWQKSKPDAYIGYYKGIENWRKLLNKHDAKATFFLSTNCFAAKGEEYKKIMQQLKLLLKEGHEIGLHPHPDSDLALQKELGKKFEATSTKFYSEGEIEKFVQAGKTIIKRHLKISPTSFRWGNLALNTHAVKALEKNGFKVDSSATPGIKGHQNDTMYYDWSRAREHYPWRLSSIDYQSTKHQNTDVLEIPIATFDFFGFKLRADPAYSALISAGMDYYYENADRTKKPFVFVVISHSPETAHKDGSKTKVITIMEEFLNHCKKFDDVKFATLKDAYKLSR